MRRTILCVGLGVLLATSSLFAAQGQGKPVQDPEYKGQIVKMDPLRGILTIRSGEGANAFEKDYQAIKLTRYYGFNNVGIIEGLRNKNFRDGTNVYFRLMPGPGTDRGLRELQLGPTLYQVPPPRK